MDCCDCKCFIYGSFYRICKYDLILAGDAFFTGDVLSLTKPNYAPSHGRVLSDRKIHFSDEVRQAIFETTITFKMCSADVRGSATPPDGITFFIAPANHDLPKDGIFNSDAKEDEQIFAVVFNTSGTNTASVPPSGKNTKGTDATSVPRIEIHVGNPHPVAMVDAKDLVGEKVTATITYRERKVTVVAVVGTEVYSLSHEVDLKKFLPEYVQVGIAGCAGKLQDKRCIFSWSFASALVRDNFF